MWGPSSEIASNPLLQLCSPCCFSSVLLCMVLSMPQLNYSPYFCQSEGSRARQAWKSSNLSNFQLFLFFLIWAIKPTRGVMARRSRRQNFQQWTIFFHFPLKPNLGVNSVRVKVKSCGAKYKVWRSCEDILGWSMIIKHFVTIMKVTSRHAKKHRHIFGPNKNQHKKWKNQ